MVCLLEFLEYLLELPGILGMSLNFVLFMEFLDYLGILFCSCIPGISWNFMCSWNSWNILSRIVFASRNFWNILEFSSLTASPVNSQENGKWYLCINPWRWLKVLLLLLQGQCPSNPEREYWKTIQGEHCGIGERNRRFGIVILMPYRKSRKSTSFRNRKEIYKAELLLLRFSHL